MPQQHAETVINQWPLHAVDGGYEMVPFKVYTQRDLDKIEQLKGLSEQTRFEMQVVSSVLPFRVNNYVIEELIDWSRVPHDPLFQLTICERARFQRQRGRVPLAPQRKVIERERRRIGSGRHGRLPVWPARAWRSTGDPALLPALATARRHG